MLSPRTDAPTAAARYADLEAARRPYLDRAREAAALTVPALMPEASYGYGEALATPRQGVGARGVNNLSNKILLAQFPPNAPFFRLVVDDLEIERLTEEDAGLKTRIDAALRRMERALATEIETGSMRVALQAAIKQLIVAGNVLIHAPEEGGLRVFHLDRYVVRRDGAGEPLEIIVKEVVPAETLPEDVRDAWPSGRPGANASVDLYTRLDRGAEGWRVSQEAGGVEIPGTVAFTPTGQIEWMALRWTQVSGDDYGRGHVEEYLGDLSSLEGLTQAIVEGAAIASKMTILVAPNGQTDAEELAEAENGAILDGSGSDVTVLQAGKLNDFRVALQAAEAITERLAFAFLLNSAVDAKSAGVTAEEIRFRAGEIEDALGGIYGVLSQELQLPLVRVLMRRQTRRGALPAMPGGMIKPKIVTGLDALGRGRDLEKLQEFLRFLASLAALSAGPLGDRLDLEAIARRAGSAYGVDLEDVLRPAAAPAAALDPAAFVDGAAALIGDGAPEGDPATFADAAIRGLEAALGAARDGGAAVDPGHGP